MKEKPPINDDYDETVLVESEGWNWRDILALGLAIMFICFGVGGCSYMFNAGEARRTESEKIPPLELPK